MRNLRTEKEIMAQWQGDQLKPLVSICCITYNHEPYIKDALEGFLIQETDFPFEILINDDSSTDRTADIIRKYEAEYSKLIKPIYQTENQYSKGRDPFQKFVLPRVKGKYVALCEGDDYWIDPLKLQKQLDFLENNPDYGLVHTDCDELYQLSGKIVKSRNKKINKYYDSYPNPFFGLLTGEYWIATCTVMVRTSLLTKAITTKIFNNHNNLQSDLPMWLEISKRYKLKYFLSSTTVYRKNLGSVSKPTTKLAKITYQESAKRIRKEFAKKYEVPEYIMRRVNEMYYSVLLTKAFHTNNHTLANTSYSFLKEYNRIDYILKYYGIKSRFLRPLIFAMRIIRKKFKAINLRIQRKII